MKSTTAGLCLAIASLAILNLTPCHAQASADTSATTSTTTTTVAPAAGATTTTTKKHHFRKQRAKRAKRVKIRKHHVSGKNLSGSVSRKGKLHKNKTYKPYSSAQQKRLNKLDSALSNPKQYKKIPELSTPGTMSPSQSAPGL
jgi:hypothetical protein